MVTPASVNTDRDEEGDFAIVGNGAGDNQGKLIFCYRVPTVPLPRKTGT